MRPPLRRFPHAAVFAVLGAWALPSISRAATPAPDVILVGEPTASDGLLPGRTGAVTLSYGVVEVFAGEPSSESVVVRHDDLTAEDRARLRDGERAILLLRRDPAHERRYVAPAPLRATPSALAAFRKWSAPEDVRAARPVSAVIAEIQGLPSESSAAPAPPAPAAPPALAPQVAATTKAPAARPDPGVIEDDEPQVVVSRFERPAMAAPAEPPPPSRAQAAPPAPPAPTPASPPASPASPASKSRSEKPAARSPLPPIPPPTPLGPALRDRDDLLPPPPGRRRR